MHFRSSPLPSEQITAPPPQSCPPCEENIVTHSQEKALPDPGTRPGRSFCFASTFDLDLFCGDSVELPGQQVLVWFGVSLTPCSYCKAQGLDLTLMGLFKHGLFNLTGRDVLNLLGNGSLWLYMNPHAKQCFLIRSITEIYHAGKQLSKHQTDL